METEASLAHPWLAVAIVLMILSCSHVFWDSIRDKRIGHPWAHTLMCALILWPLPYLFWLFWWPRKLRQRLFGSDQERAEAWAQRRLRRGKLE